MGDSTVRRTVTRHVSTDLCKKLATFGLESFTCDTRRGSNGIRHTRGSIGEETVKLRKILMRKIRARIIRSTLGRLTRFTNVGTALDVGRNRNVIRVHMQGPIARATHSRRFKIGLIVAP